MKFQPRPASALAFRVLPALAFSAVGAGCVGYNSTLFYTKSNAGLDFDAKPPTTEITVSRKEGVIAPSFEGGKTPPVMASFKPHGGNGNGFENFFFGVDQTFAGGDAAIAMTRLYDSPVAGPYTLDPKTNESADYDSAIVVTEPTARFGWQKIPEPSATRPFVFATDTLLGLKVGWTGVASVPDAVKLGFNRKELAWAPISKTPKAAGETKVKLKSPSFLATINNDAQVGDDHDGKGAKIRSLQYFATGEAATLLARQPAVREAMLKRMDPDFRLRLTPVVLEDALVSIDTLIDNLAASDPASPAKAHQAKLDALAGITRPDSSVVTYSFDSAAGVLARRPWAGQPEPNSAWDFQTYTSYLAQLRSNLSALRLHQAALTAGKSVSFRDGTAAAAPLTEAVRAQLTDAQVQDTLRLDQLREQLGTHRDVVAAYLYALVQLSPR